MRQPEFTIKQGDTSPPLVGTLLGADGSVQDLSGATVKFNMRRGSTLVVDHSTCSIITPLGGRVSYEWQAGDTATAGAHYGEFEATLADGTTLTFPNGQEILINIVPQVA